MTRLERALLWAATALVGASGIGFAISKYLVTSDDPYSVVGSPWQPFFLKFHVLVAPLLVFAFGGVFLRHVWRQWTTPASRGRKTGAAVFLLLVPMIATGYLIQTVTSRPGLKAVVIAHVATGVAYVGAILGHQLRAVLKSRARRRETETAAVRRAS